MDIVAMGMSSDVGLVEWSGAGEESDSNCACRACMISRSEDTQSYYNGINRYYGWVEQYVYRFRDLRWWSQ